MNQDEIRLYIEAQKQALRERAMERPEFFELLDIQYAIWLTLGDVLSTSTIPEDRNLLLVRKIAEGLLEECHEIGCCVYQEFLAISQVEADRILTYVPPEE